MPKGYVIFSEKIHDQPKYEAYVQKAVSTILQSGGRPLIFHKGVDVIEGKWDAQQIVVLEFDSVEAAKKWYNSPEYQAMVGERHASADADTIIVPGME